MPETSLKNLLPLAEVYMFLAPVLRLAATAAGEAEAWPEEAACWKARKASLRG